MEYRTFCMLNDRIVDWSYTLPRNFDLIAGIPRSGLLAANLLALHLNLPVTDLEGLLDGRVIRAGQRYEGDASGEILRSGARVLVVDDSVYSGNSLESARKQVADARLPHRVDFGAVFVTPEAVEAGKVKLFAEAVPGPRVFEWNVMHTSMMAHFCLDLDSVLCREPAMAPGRRQPPEALFGGASHFLPRYRVGWLVTSRPERERASVEQALREQRVEYGELVMMEDESDTSDPGVLCRFRAEVYVRTGAQLFVSGSVSRSPEIARLANRPVFCAATREMLYPGDTPRPRYPRPVPPSRVRLSLRWGSRLPARIARKCWKVATGREQAWRSGTPLNDLTKIHDQRSQDPS